MADEWVSVTKMLNGYWLDYWHGEEHVEAEGPLTVYGAINRLRERYAGGKLPDSMEGVFD